MGSLAGPGTEARPDDVDHDEQLARTGVTAGALNRYLRDHPIAPGAPPPGPVILAWDPSNAVALVRWPNGAVRWETQLSLLTRGFRRLPEAGLQRSV